MNTFDDYYASSANFTESTGCQVKPKSAEAETATATSCPVCITSMDAWSKTAKICDYASLVEAKIVEHGEPNSNIFKLNTSKVIKSTGERFPEAGSYHFLISSKCLESCPQLDSDAGLLLISKSRPEGSCFAFDSDTVIVPSTYMNRFDAKAALKKGKCPQ